MFNSVREDLSFVLQFFQLFYSSVLFEVLLHEDYMYLWFYSKNQKMLPDWLNCFLTDPVKT